MQCIHRTQSPCSVHAFPNHGPSASSSLQALELLELLHLVHQLRQWPLHSPAVGVQPETHRALGSWCKQSTRACSCATALSLQLPHMAAAKASPEQLKQWFNAIDKDNNGLLTPMELQSALQIGGLNFSLATVAHIIRIHDRDGSGTIDFEEFGRLHEFLTNVQHSFEYFDQDKSNSLSYDEIFMALSHAGYNLERPALQVVFQRFDPSRSGALGLTEFLALTLFLRSATATFNAFDAPRSGWIKLSFSQFLYASANCL